MDTLVVSNLWLSLWHFVSPINPCNPTHKHQPANNIQRLTPTEPKQNPTKTNCNSMQQKPTRWAHISYKWSYNLQKCLVTPLSGVITLLMTGDGVHLSTTKPLQKKKLKNPKHRIYSHLLLWRVWRVDRWLQWYDPRRWRQSICSSPGRVALRPGKNT